MRSVKKFEMELAGVDILQKVGDRTPLLATEVSGQQIQLEPSSSDFQFVPTLATPGQARFFLPFPTLARAVHRALLRQTRESPRARVPRPGHPDFSRAHQARPHPRLAVRGC